MWDDLPIHYCHQALGDLPPHQGWLHPEELRFLQTLRFEKRRNDWLLGRWTAKQALLSFFESKCIAINPHSIAILKGSTGAPEMVFESSVPPCSLSISHRDGHAIAAVAPGVVAIGCDLEVIEPRSEAFLSDYFLESELAFLSGIPLDQKDLYANLFWCVKESVMKATGEGMGLHPRRVEVEISDMDVAAKIIPEVGEFKGKWRREEDMVMGIVIGGGATISADLFVNPKD